MTTFAAVQSKIRQNIKAKAPTLTWEQISSSTLRSTCKRFTVGRLKQADGAMHYEAWMGKEPLAFRLLSAEEAKDMCEAHARASK